MISKEVVLDDGGCWYDATGDVVVGYCFDGFVKFVEVDDGGAVCCEVDAGWKGVVE